MVDVEKLLLAGKILDNRSIPANGRCAWISEEGLLYLGVKNKRIGKANSFARSKAMSRPCNRRCELRVFHGGGAWARIRLVGNQKRQLRGWDGDSID